MSMENREYPVDPLAAQRLEACNKCAFYILEEKRCSITGLFLKHIINQERASCPVGKW